MKNKTAKQTVNSYRLKCALVVLLYLLALAGLVFAIKYSVFIAMIGIAVLASTLRTSIEKVRKSEIDSVIYEELDPEKFGEILSLGVLKKSTRHKMLYYMSSGKHDEILSLVEEIEQKTNNPIDIGNNLYRLGYVYFERGEYDKLPSVFKKFEKLKRDNPKYQITLNGFTVFDKFDAFADDDFEYVVDVCDIDLKELDTKKQNHNLTKINVSFYRAVSLYKLGKLDMAKQGFEEIIEFAPKMYKAKLSKDFIDLIEKS